MNGEKYQRIAERTAVGKALVRTFAAGEGGQSYLLASSDTLLCERLAFAAAIAENGGDEKLRRRITEGMCGDVRVLGADGFRTEDADEVVSLCRLAPGELKRRVFVLHLALSSDAAQNKLLKTLEDTTASAVFFVLAPSEKAVLPTVASRLETLAPDAPDIAAEFGGGSGENLPYALYGGSGSLTEFDGLLSGRTTDSLVRAIELANILGPSARMLEAAGLLGSTRDGMAGVLLRFEKIMGDVIRFHGGVTPDTYGLFTIRGIAEKFPLAAMPGVLKATHEAVARTAGGNLAAVADMFAITVSEVMYNAKSSGRKV